MWLAGKNECFWKNLLQYAFCSQGIEPETLRWETSDWTPHPCRNTVLATLVPHLAEQVRNLCQMALCFIVVLLGWLRGILNGIVMRFWGATWTELQARHTLCMLHSRATSTCHTDAFYCRIPTQLVTCSLAHCLVLFFCTDGRSSMYLRDVGIYLQHHTALQPRRRTSSSELTVVNQQDVAPTGVANNEQ